jgi:hypothetical protein
MLAAVLMVIAAVGSAILFTLSNQQTLTSRGKQEQQSAISDDLAAILELNDRYSCSNGADACAVATSDPGEDGYYPQTSAPDDNFDIALCANGGLLNNLISAITDQAAPASFASLGVQRKEPVIDTTDLASNRYSITWVDAGGRRLRQVTLVPTVAHWCP